MSRLVVICGEAMLVEDEHAPPDRLQVSASAAAALARLKEARATCVLIVPPDSRDGAAGARRRERLRDGLARHGAQIDDVLATPAGPAAALSEALQRFRAVAGETPVLGETLGALEAAASLGCPRLLVRTPTGRATQAAGIPDRLLPVGVHADLAAAVGPALRFVR